MDHKVSKDMISSGMIPSGEKTQADLGKTQYGSAPSPSKLMEAYKSMYDKKEEVINEMKMGDVSGSADFASRNIKGAKGAAPAPKPAPKPETKTEKPKTETDKMLDKVSDRRVEKAVNRDKDVRRARVNYIMTKYGESVDLLAAYRSVYEHHQKDKDGNTIPHEDEEVNEGKIPAGLQAYLDKKKGKKEDKKEINEVVVSGTLATLGALGAKAVAAGAGKAAAVGATKAAAGATKAAAAGAGKAAAASAGKAAGSTIAKGGIQKTITRAGIKAGGKTGGRIAQSIAKDPMGALDKAADISYKAQMVGSMLPKPVIKNRGSGGGVSGGMSQTVSADADLFDIVKGQLLDEGLTEEEIKDIMLTLTPDEILNEISGELAMKASKAADMKRSELARSGDRAGAADKAAQASRLYKKGAERNIAKQDLSKPLNPQRKDYPMGKGANYQQKPGM